MKLYDFLESFMPDIPITILDEDGEFIDITIVGEVTQRIMNRREVLKSYIKENEIIVVTMCPEAHTIQPPNLQANEMTEGRMIAINPNDISLFSFARMFFINEGMRYRYCEKLLVGKRGDYKPVYFPKIKHTYEVFNLLGNYWGKWNECPDSSVMAAKAQSWEEKFGIEVSCIAHDIVDFTCKRKMTESEIEQLIHEIEEFAPNTLDCYTGNDTLEKAISEQQTFGLWWD